MNFNGIFIAFVIIIVVISVLSVLGVFKANNPLLAPSQVQCSDRIDNDVDGLIDLKDSGCSSKKRCI